MPRLDQVVSSSSHGQMPSGFCPYTPRSDHFSKPGWLPTVNTWITAWAPPPPAKDHCAYAHGRLWMPRNSGPLELPSTNGWLELMNKHPSSLTSQVGKLWGPCSTLSLRTPKHYHTPVAHPLIGFLPSLSYFFTPLPVLLGNSFYLRYWHQNLSQVWFSRNPNKISILISIFILLLLHITRGLLKICIPFLLRK